MTSRFVRAIGALSLSCGLLMAGPALADTVSNFYGNTVETTMDGATTKWHFDADGKTKATLPDGVVAPGAWVMKNGQFCVTVGANPESCTAVQDGKNVGDTWSATNSAGQSFTVTIKAGR
jgi:hypothetical protein